MWRRTIAAVAWLPVLCFAQEGEISNLIKTVPARDLPWLSARAQMCVVEAAQFHRVNQDVLVAMLRVESNAKSPPVTTNKNRSIDVGLLRTNSVHFNDLLKKGVAPKDLLDECVSLYVGAWMYSKKVFKYGNTWRAIGSYHSDTPRLNYRYQALVHNELVAMKVLSAAKITVPPLSPP